MIDFRATASDWIQPLSANGEATVAMVCFPPAGGGVIGFRPWAEPLRAHANLYAASLPGREYRVREDPVPTLDPLVSPLVQAMIPPADRPLLVFGHSFGALLAYEVVYRLCEEVLIEPAAVHLVVSGRCAPHVASQAPRLSHLSPRDIVFRIAERHGNIPVALLEEPDYVAMLGRALQADLQITEEYSWPERPPLPCPVTALGGLSDPVVPTLEIEAWRRHTQGPFDSRLFPGDHFYFRTSSGQRALMDVIARCCASLAASDESGVSAQYL
ncbi:MAG: alpha/beta fold hydrolase [Chromatiaceae bacterium]|nr:alpha/beta fold hydrolase [Chromatiaceae bacterium]